MKYRKKSIELFEAIQFHGKRVKGLPLERFYKGSDSLTGFGIYSNDGLMMCDIDLGDYIIIGSKGGISVCKKDVFKILYVKVKENEKLFLIRRNK